MIIRLVYYGYYILLLLTKVKKPTVFSNYMMCLRLISKKDFQILCQ